MRAIRDPDGAISLRCASCGAPWFAGVSHVELVDARGRSRPTLPSSLHVDTSHVVLDYDTCFVGQRVCRVSAHTRLVAPMSDVIEVRHRIEPIRILGYVALGMGASMVGAASWYTFAPQAGWSSQDRAVTSAVFAIPGFALAVWGLWAAFAPATEEIWRPTPERP